MKIAILSESSADDAALRILVDGALGINSIDILGHDQLRGRGWPGLKTILQPAIKYFHYRTEAEGLVVVSDGNHMPFAANSSHSRMIELQKAVDEVLPFLTPVHSKPALKVAVGVACPAIEAWLLCSTRSEVNEGAWRRGLETRSDPYTKLQLKQWLYGVERPSLALETEKMRDAATLIAPQIRELEEKFPIGFGTLASTLRSWLRVDG